MPHANIRAPHASPIPIALALALMGCSLSAWAGLGGDASSIRADSARFRGQLVRTSLLAYERHDIAIGAGGMVHEYLAPSGKVFAVTWQGQLPPDLVQLFGAYFEPIRSAMAAHSGPGTHRQFFVNQSDLVVRAFGHVRDFRGLAYVPSLVPAGVEVGSLP